MVAGSTRARLASNRSRFSRFSGLFHSSRRKKKGNKAVDTRSTVRTTGPRCVRKALKENPAAEPMMILGGSPTNVATPPILERTASPKRKGTGFTPRTSAIETVTGATITTVVTLSKTVETRAVNHESPKKRSHGRPRLIRERRMAKYWKAPVGWMMPTMVIIPKRSPTVLKSTASMARSKS